MAITIALTLTLTISITVTVVLDLTISLDLNTTLALTMYLAGGLWRVTYGCQMTLTTTGGRGDIPEP